MWCAFWADGLLSGASGALGVALGTRGSGMLGGLAFWRLC